MRAPERIGGSYDRRARNEFRQRKRGAEAPLARNAWLLCQLPVRHLRHFEHVHGRLALAHGSERGVGLDHARVALRLELVPADVLPQLADHLGPRDRPCSDDRCELGARREGLPELRPRVPSTLAHVATSLGRRRDWPAEKTNGDESSSPFDLRDPSLRSG